jgi:periplasmic protein TonB
MELKKSEKANLENKKTLFLQIGLITVLSLLLIAFEWTTRDVMTGSLGELGDVVMEEEIIPITRQEEVKPPPPPPPQVPEILQIVEDDVDIEDELIIDDIEARQNTRIEMTDFSFEEEAEAEEEIFIIVEDMPTFMGKDSNEFRNWIAANLKYPQIAAENGIQGRVFVQFVVNANGRISDAVVVRGVDPALDQEAVRVIMSSPSWTPGKQRGKPVRVRFTFPINFVLQ